ncbi:glutamate 5-kinase [Candidatus Avelusimicrobium fimicolum]|uniref:glutamate 5-kinase n=1 Tax=Candidatus Avelusimicrobium fimicolum TaxID=3416216 RepID=UPI003CA0A7E6|nr:glutamate 5-kinase [Spirochaetia bacterium]
MKTLIKKAKRIVFKFGTNALSTDNGDLALSRLYSFMEDIAALRAQGKEVMIVTSGAVGVGKRRLGLTSAPDVVSLKQACAAVGQISLMKLYEDGFKQLGVVAAQVLLTEDDFSHRSRYLSLRDTLNRLLELGCIPVINQNDTVSTNELRGYKEKGVNVCFSDNDKLSALVASGMDADLLCVMSDVDGLYNGDPRKDKNAKLIDVVKGVTPEIEALGFCASSRGRGGMKTKLEAAKVVTRSGAAMIIAYGKKPGAVSAVFGPDFKGTLFLPVEDLPGKKLWLAYATNVAGGLTVNDGAKKAMCEKGSSLLPAGITAVAGEFEAGDSISILDEAGQEFARGLVNYSSKECRKIAGRRSEEIAKKIGYKNYDEAVHRDNIVLL